MATAGLAPVVVVVGCVAGLAPVVVVVGCDTGLGAADSLTGPLTGCVEVTVGAPFCPAGTSRLLTCIGADGAPTVSLT